MNSEIGLARCACLGTLVSMLAACGGGTQTTDGSTDVTGGGDTALDGTLGGDAARDASGGSDATIDARLSTDVLDAQASPDAEDATVTSDSPDTVQSSDASDAAGDGAPDVTDPCANVVCTPTDACHLAGVCDPTTGQCTRPSAPDGTACDDGSACTQSDTCHAGTCAGTTTVFCSPTDQCHPAGTCDPATGQCSNPQSPDGKRPSATTETFVHRRSPIRARAARLHRRQSCRVYSPHAVSSRRQCNPWHRGGCLLHRTLLPAGTSCSDGLSCTLNDVVRDASGTCAGTPNTTAVVDQQQTAFNTGVPMPDDAQSFTAGVTGNLTGIALFNNGDVGTHTATITIYSGAGNTGLVLYTGTGTFMGANSGGLHRNAQHTGPDRRGQRVHVPHQRVIHGVVFGLSRHGEPIRRWAILRLRRHGLRHGGQ